MFLSRLFQNKLLALIVFVALFFLFRASFVSIFTNSSNEIVYEYDKTVFMCLKQTTRCVYIAHLKLANTGNNQLENLTVLNTELPEGINLSFTYLNINASRPRKGDPDITQSRDAPAATVLINHFSPGTLIDIEYSGSIQTQQRDMLIHFSPAIHSGAKTIQADPQ